MNSNDWDEIQREIYAARRIAIGKHKICLTFTVKGNSFEYLSAYYCEIPPTFKQQYCMEELKTIEKDKWLFRVKSTLSIILHLCARSVFLCVCVSVCAACMFCVSCLSMLGLNFKPFKPKTNQKKIN